MYKLIIADDEEKLRRGLCNFINWSDLGFELVASFNDGREVLQYLSTNAVDVILTDIQMTEVSGLDVAKFVSDNNSGCSVVVISGFKEFEYAKQAIEYNVEHYLIKPVDIDEIGKVFTELKRKLDQEKQKENTLQKDRELVEELLPVLREQLFIDLVMGTVFTERELQKKIRFAGLSIQPSTSCVLVDIKVSDYEEFLENKWKYGKEQLHEAICNVIQEQSKDVMHYIVSHQYNHYKLLSIPLKDQSKNLLMQQVEIRMNEVHEIIKEFLGLSVSIQLKGYCNHLLEVSSLFREEALAEIQINIDQSYLIEKFKLMLSKINTSNNETIQGYFLNFINEISKLPFDKQQHLILRLILSLSENYTGLNINYLHTAANKMITSSNSPVDKQELITHQSHEILSDIFNKVTAEPEKSSNLIIKKAKQYIETNYYKDLSLGDVATQVFLNPIYFSRFFKQQTGENFIDYVTKIRMDKAIQLLIENKYKIYEISKMVGFNSDKYFAKLFKQYTGYSPKDYLRFVMKEGESEHG